jgi:DNA-binding response OmpR family regulator
MDKRLLKSLHLLLIDDNYRIHAELHELLSPMFQSLTLAHDVPSAEQKLRQQPIDIVITDIEMPGVDGLSFIEQLRERHHNLPIIVLSAHATNDYLLRAANLQIDGYIIKPLNFRKLAAALARAVKRLPNRLERIVITPKISYEPQIKSLKVDGEEVSLGQKECLLLELFISHSDHLVSKEEILQHVWPSRHASDSALKNLLSELRKKLKYPVIENHPGRGWHLSLETP